MDDRTAKLTPKQVRFVEEYLVDLNATQAAIRAGYSRKTAEQQGYQLLQKTSVADAISTEQAKRSDRLEIHQDMVVAGLLAEARRVGEGSSHSARVAAWAHLGKHLGLFVDRRLLGIRCIDDLSEEELLAFLGGEPEECELLAAVSGDWVPNGER